MATVQQDFHSFMLSHRFNHSTCSTDELKHAFECGWELGYEQHVKESGVTTIMLLCGLLLLLIGVALH